jgi:hypothetical protein
MLLHCCTQEGTRCTSFLASEQGGMGMTCHVLQGCWSAPAQRPTHAAVPPAPLLEATPGVPPSPPPPPPPPHPPPP